MKFVRILLLLPLFCFSCHSSFANNDVRPIELLPWEKVNGIIPKYSKFTVLDLETGKYFKVQRRAGSHHADVQPLTSNETEIMKEIYKGKWSWRRRAIVVIYQDRWIAASMHGMPHGAGALKNNFPGHFCIHFYGSTTHRTNYMDLSHKLMILKAAGQLEKYLGSADPYEVVRSFIVSLKQQDSFILSSASSESLINDNKIENFEEVNLVKMVILPSEDHLLDLHLDVNVEIHILLKDKGRKIFKGSIHVFRLSQLDAWKVDAESFFQQLKIE